MSDVKETVFVEGEKQLDLDQEVKFVGKNQRYINPSPCCGHNDCFVLYGELYRETNIYICFSCSFSGTIEGAEQKMEEKKEFQKKVKAFENKLPGLIEAFLEKRKSSEEH